jgi:hypothetical protein
MEHIWKAEADPKVKFFARLVVHDKVLTAHNLLKRNWPCDVNCSLCLCIHETTQHLLAECNFTEALWNFVASRFMLRNYTYMKSKGGPSQWLDELIHVGPRKEIKIRLGILFFS